MNVPNFFQFSVNDSFGFSLEAYGDDSHAAEPLGDIRDSAPALEKELDLALRRLRVRGWLIPAEAVGEVFDQFHGFSRFIRELPDQIGQHGRQRLLRKPSVTGAATD